MSITNPQPVANRLINRLPSRERNSILGICEPVDMLFASALCEPQQILQHVYFPLSGFISLSATVEGHHPLGTRLIGNEGMLGATLVLGVDNVPLRGVVQGPGSALRISAAQFLRAASKNSHLARSIHRYLYLSLVELAQTTACTHFHGVEPRLARWLLMIHDRAHADHFHLTHEFLADLLGVRRSSVTVAAGALQRRNLIHYTRGEITILNRKGLEATSCACYDAVINDYTRLFS